MQVREEIRSGLPEREQEILVTSFGTSEAGTRVRTIGAIEEEIEEVFGAEYEVRRAFTSRMVLRRIEREQDLKIDDIEAALEKAAGAGVSHLVIACTHLMAGHEYDKVRQAAEGVRGRIGQITLTAPLLGSEEDCRRLLAAVIEDTQPLCDEESAVIFMGHGTDAASNEVYARMQAMLQEAGEERYFIATVESTPALDEVLDQLSTASVRRIVLQPLMVVAGDHACNDMAGDEPGSWKMRCRAEGYEVLPVLKGLGQIPQVRQMYVDHIRNVL